MLFQAVVTEISYNYEKIPFRAEIEFIQSADWERELKTLLRDLSDGSGNVLKDCTNEETDAGIAYAKIKAVYPKMTREDIAKGEIENMLKKMSHLLGTIRTIDESDSLQFYKRLQKFIDSSATKGRAQKHHMGREMEFWPLIKVIRLYIKSPALSTGAVVVDLPGVQDSNAARAAVAEGYMKQITGLWIVTPINRAVDDKAAKNLLGQSFKRQLKLDGGFESVTFICSKTDDISLMEAQDSLGLGGELGPMWKKSKELTQTLDTLEESLDYLRNSMSECTEVLNDVDEQLEVWEALQEDAENSKEIFAPKQPSKKRKAVEKHRLVRKKCRQSRVSVDGSDDEIIVSDSQDDAEKDEESSDDKQGQQPLTTNEVMTKITELRNTRKGARRSRSDLGVAIDDVQKQRIKAEIAKEEIMGQIATACIAGRNQYSKDAIQQDYAAGIKEVDQELAAEEDEATFNPEDEVRDYDEIARGLKVFCVSSRAYQKLSGRLQNEQAVSGFKHIEQTEIPMLQKHCEKLTEARRIASCQKFLNNLSQLLNSQALWASTDRNGVRMTKEQRAKEKRYLAGNMEELELKLESIVKETVEELKPGVMYQAVDRAMSQAVKTVQKWASRVNLANHSLGGYHWQSYKAICRRDGVYTNSFGPHDWNKALAEPMLKIIAPGWDRAFSRLLPPVMASFAAETMAVIRSFHKEVDGRARKLGASIAKLSTLQNSLSVYNGIFKDHAGVVKDNICAAQRDINRKFVPVIQEALGRAYTACMEERGIGSFMRMKDAMYNHVNTQRFSMFQDSVDRVQSELLAMLCTQEKLLEEKIEQASVAIRRDYLSILGGDELAEGQILPRSQRVVREEVMNILDEVENIFRKVAGLPVQSQEDQGKEQVIGHMAGETAKSALFVDP
ncbi:MAG: hypothetical protein Q9209_007452 [Squamulea sp. 1 TL-2023]